MLTDTQISTYLIPASIWAQGHPTRKDLPPLAQPARDALDIERRAQKDVNLNNEARRYTLCCERMQGIVQQLSRESGLLPTPRIWSSNIEPDGMAATARAYLGLINAISRILRRSPYPRVSALFFPPDHTQSYLQVIDAIRQQPNLDRLLDQAARSASLPDARFAVLPEQCRAALDQRIELVHRATSDDHGIVDVIEFV